MGIYDGAGIHGTDAEELDRHRRLARLHPHAHARGRGAVRAGAASARRSTSSEPRRRGDLVDRHLLPARLAAGRRGGRRGEARGCRCNAPLALAQHRVPHGRRVARALDAQPGPRRRPIAVGATPGLHELPPRGDLTRGRVDEEHRHRRARLATPPGWRGRARPVRPRPAPARRRRADAPRLRHRRRPARRSGPARGLEPDEVDYRGAAPLRRAPVRARRRAEHRRAQARRRCARSTARCVEHGDVAATRPTCCPRPRSPSACREVLKAAEVAALLDRIPADDAARAARPGAVRAGLRLRPARRGAGHARRRVARLRRRAGPRGGQGRQDALRPGGEHALRVARPLPRARAPGAARPTPASRRCSSRSRAGGCRRPTCAGACAPGRGTPRPGRRVTRTRCATPSRPTCWRAGPTCGRSRSCSVTARCRRLRSTLG